MSIQRILLMTIMLSCLLLTHTGFAAAPIGIGDPLLPGAGNPGYDVQHYAIALEIESISSGALSADVVITLTAETTLERFNLDFSNLTIESLQVNGADAQHRYRDGELTVIPSEPIAAGTTAEVEIQYSGVPRPIINPIIGAGGYTRYADGIYVAGQPNSATSFLPVNDHPRDKATFEFTITVPQPYMAVSNGELLAITTNDDRVTFVWAMEQPMATYLLTLGVGEYDVIEQVGPNGLPIINYLPLDASDTIRDAFDQQPAILEFLESIFGPYPFDTAGALVVDNPRMGFALETQTRPIYSASMLNWAREIVVVHELAHQWFGNSLSVYQWSDIWLNEGFASYAEALWAEHTQGEATFKRYLSSFYVTARLSSVLPGAPTLDTLFDGAVYHRGALTLHALRLRVGDEIFFETLREYVQQYQYQNVTTADFVEVAERVSGQSLDDLFETWLFGTLPPRNQLGLD